MIVAQREEQIIQLLHLTGTITAEQLKELQGVSAATVRRDLLRLEEAGRLVRVHGGATLPATEAPFDVVMGQASIEKDRIAAAAAKLVGDGDVVILDIGTTTMRIAQHLRGRPVTVVTTSLAVVDVLRTDDTVTLICIGGTLRRNFRSFVGPLAVKALRRIRADIGFLTCTGVRPDGAIVDDIGEEALVKQALMRASDRVILVAAATKFPGTGTLRIGELDQIDTVVCDAGADRDTLELCTRAGGQVVIA